MALTQPRALVTLLFVDGEGVLGRVGHEAERRAGVGDAAGHDGVFLVRVCQVTDRGAASRLIEDDDSRRIASEASDVVTKQAIRSRIVGREAQRSVRCLTLLRGRRRGRCPSGS